MGKMPVSVRLGPHPHAVEIPNHFYDAAQIVHPHGNPVAQVETAVIAAAEAVEVDERPHALLYALGAQVHLAGIDVPVGRTAANAYPVSGGRLQVFNHAEKHSVVLLLGGGGAYDAAALVGTIVPGDVAIIDVKLLSRSPVENHCILEYVGGEHVYRCDEVEIYVAVGIEDNVVDCVLAGAPVPVTERGVSIGCKNGMPRLREENVAHIGGPGNGGHDLSAGTVGPAVDLIVLPPLEGGEVAYV